MVGEDGSSLAAEDLSEAELVPSIRTTLSNHPVLDLPSLENEPRTQTSTESLGVGVGPTVAGKWSDLRSRRRGGGSATAAATVVVAAIVVVAAAARRSGGAELPLLLLLVSAAALRFLLLLLLDCEIPTPAPTPAATRTSRTIKEKRMGRRRIKLGRLLEATPRSRAAVLAGL